MPRLPELRKPDQSHNAGQFSAIEEIFWTNKPTHESVYQQKEATLESPHKISPQLASDIISRIWSTDVHHRLIPAAEIAHLTIFSIPPFIDQLDAMHKGFKRHWRYEEDTFDNDTSTFWTSHDYALNIGGRQHQDSDHLRFSIQSFHESSRSIHHMNPARTFHGNEFLSVPQSALALSIYDVCRIGEELAIKQGSPVTDEDRNTQYAFFREVVYDGGIWMPEVRSDMEIIAQQLDNLAVLNSSTRELSERTIRRAISKIPGITYETVAAILRPGARAIFSSICETYGYLDTNPRKTPEPPPVKHGL